MIVLDTCVVSELMRGPDTDARVLAWVRGLEEQPVTTVVTRAEILSGIALLPAGRRRDSLAQAAAAALSSIEMVLPITAAAADRYAEIVVQRARSGRPMGAMDALIAAVASSIGASVATRDIAGFEGVGVEIVDPWG